MTHGSGGISHGGGGGGFGGGSGGGFSTWTNHTSHYSRRRRNTSSSNGDSAECCCALCSLIFFLLCLIKMKPRTRIILTWFYCILGAGLTGGLIGRRYSSVTLSASPEDIRSVDTVSSTFCQSLLIDSSSQITTYRFDSKPKINKTASVKYEKGISASIMRDSYEYWGFYLLKGSTASIYVCAEGRLDLYIIKGKDNLDAWIENADCLGCVERVYSIFYCSSHIYAQKYTVTASTSNQYYFLLADDGYNILNPGSIEANIDFKLDRKTYDMEGSHVVCSKDFDCDVSIPLTVSVSVVYHVPSESSFDTTVTVYCRPRVYMYILLFVILPLTCGTLVTLLILGISRRARGLNAESSQSASSEHLHGYANESCPINTSPPSYSEAPPSYEEAVTRGMK